MSQYQESMLRMTISFLNAQEVVMLAYLSNSSRSPLQSVLPAVSPPHAVSPVPIFPTALHGHSVSVAAVVEDPATATEADQEPAMLTTDNLFAAFLDLVSQRTGYPVEMLELSMDLESDLGIDSIKRIEIFANFKRLLPESMMSAFEERLEELASIRTLQSIKDHLLKFSK
ncbi:MAG: phosphopantetheine-binding protein [Candidatus Obscuribacterales bacterium]